MKRMTPKDDDKGTEAGRRSYRGDPDFLRRECVTTRGSEVVRAGEAFGMRWKHGPFRFERYTGDAVPEPDASGPLRLVIWQPQNRVAKPKGWIAGFPKMSLGRTGHVAVSGGTGHEKNWSSHARRHLAQWRRQSGWEIAESDIGPFLDAYRRSTQDRVLRLMFSYVLKEKIAGHGERVRLHVARQDGEIKAGFACVDVPETGESLHLISFIRPEARDASVGIALMDHWFRTAPLRGIRFLDFGLFWRKGDPRDWKGFSRFKSQFVSTYVDYPAPFLRFAGRWGAGR